MLQKSNMWKTAGIFLLNPSEELYLVDISRRIGLAHTSVKRNIAKLLKMGIITEKVTKKGKRKFPVYKANINGKSYKDYKKIYNLVSVTESGLVKFLEEKLMPKCIVMFGSYQKGDDIEDSDIDLFVECMQEKMDLAKYEKILKRRVQLHHNKDFSSYPKELKNSIINGNVLFGFLEGFK